MYSTNFIYFCLTTLPSGVLGNVADNLIIFTANFLVRLSSSFENSLLSIFKNVLRWKCILQPWPRPITNTLYSKKQV